MCFKTPGVGWLVGWISRCPTGGTGRDPMIRKTDINVKMTYMDICRGRSKNPCFSEKKKNMVQWRNGVYLQQNCYLSNIVIFHWTMIMGERVGVKLTHITCSSKLQLHDESISYGRVQHFFKYSSMYIYIYMYIQHQKQHMEPVKLKPLWESRLFLFPFSAGLNQQQETILTYPTWGCGTSNWVCVFGPIHDNKPSKRHPKSRDCRGSFPNLWEPEPNEQAICRMKSRTWAIKKNVSVESIVNLLFSTKHLQIYLDEISPYCSKREINEYPMWSFHEVYMMDKSLGEFSWVWVISWCLYINCYRICLINTISPFKISPRLPGT